MAKKHLVVIQREDGSAASYSMKQWLRNNPAFVPEGLDPTIDTSHTLRRGLRHDGWVLKETADKVLLIKPTYDGDYTFASYIIESLSESDKQAIESEILEAEKTSFSLEKDEFITIKLNESFLEHHDLPDILYPIPTSRFEELVESGILPFNLLLYFLQEYGRSLSEWQSIETAIHKLTTLLAPVESHTFVNVNGDNWFIVCGKVDLTQEIVTVQRGGHLIAAIRPLPDGRLVFSAYRPLDAKSAEYLIGLSAIPDHDHGVCMRENNWEYALDCSAGMGNMYASERGEAYLSYWQYGLGLSNDKSVIEDWYNQRSLMAVNPNYAAVQLGIYYENSPNYTADE